MNGIASTRSEPNTISRLRSHGRLAGSLRRTSTATPASAAITQTTGGFDLRPSARRDVPERGSTSTAISSTSRTPRRTTGTRRRTVARRRQGVLEAASVRATRSAVIDRSTETPRSRKRPAAPVPSTIGAPSVSSTPAASEEASSAAAGRDPVPATTNVAPGTRSRTIVTTCSVIESMPSIDPASTTPSTSVTSSSPSPSAATIALDAIAGRDPSLPSTVTGSRSEASRYQPLPMIPRSASSASTAPTSARCPWTWSRSSAKAAITEPASGADHALERSPSSSRTNVPVMPCVDGRLPVPIVVRVAAGSIGSEPVTASSVPAPRAIARRTKGHAPGRASRSREPTPFHAMSTTSGVPPSAATPSIASPVLTSGCGRRSPVIRSRVGAMASRPTPGGSDPARTPEPRNTTGTRVSPLPAPGSGPGHDTRTPRCTSAATSAAPVVAAITSGDRPSRNPDAI